MKECFALTGTSGLLVIGPRAPAPAEQRACSWLGRSLITLLES